MVFQRRILLSTPTTNLPTNWPTVHVPSNNQLTDPPTLDHQLTNSVTIFERLGNREIFIAQNTNTAGKINLIQHLFLIVQI